MSMRNRLGFDPLWIMVGLLGLLLPALAVTQYLWLNRLSEWQERRTLQVLQTGADRLAEEFDAALEPFQQAFQFLFDPWAPDGPERQFAATWDRIEQKSPLPASDLVRRVLWVSPGERSKDYEVREFLPRVGLLRACDPPKEVAALAAALGAYPGVPRMEPGRIWGRMAQGVPVLLIPQPAAPGIAGAGASWVILVLDRGFLTGQFLPALVRKHLAGEEARNLRVAVVCASDPPSFLYASEAGLTTSAMSRSDASAELLRLRKETAVIVRAPGAGIKGASPGSGSSRMAAEGWRLLVRHRAGSVEAAMGALRRRNMALSAGILLALASSILLLGRAARRARRLAELQMDFISGVSHELRTPLAVISSAGENLADAVVQDPERTREYGRIIHREGRRLGRMVDRVLQFARLQAEPPRRALAPQAIRELIAEALETYRVEIEERRISVRTEFAPALEALPGDRDSLVAALENLISNALKYGGDGGEVVIRVSGASLDGMPAVAVTVSDRGPGIPRAEQEHLFQPFVRGRLARERQIKGSGLGLSLVREVALAHGGNVRVESEPGAGARLVLTLPAGLAVAKARAHQAAGEVRGAQGAPGSDRSVEDTEAR